LKGSTDADLQHCWKTEDVLEGTPDVLPIAQAMSAVGKTVKSAVEQELGVGEDILCVEWGLGRVSLEVYEYEDMGSAP
jgi:hypothetical protein